MRNEFSYLLRIFLRKNYQRYNFLKFTCTHLNLNHQNLFN